MLVRINPSETMSGDTNHPFMLNKQVLIWSALLALSTGGSATQPVMKVKLLTPAQLDAPKEVQQKLQRMGCMIPQDEAAATRPSNIVAGEFARKGQRDWAALCAKDGRMRIVVLWGGENKCSMKPSDREDPITNVWSQQRDEPPFQTYVQAAKPQRILELRKFFGDPQHNEIIHDGVEYGGENASVIYYCDSGVWHELQGDD